MDKIFYPPQFQLINIKIGLKSDKTAELPQARDILTRKSYEKSANLLCFLVG